MASYVPTHHYTTVDYKTPESTGTATVHHIEAGSPSAPTFLLLHGFPSASYQYASTMPLLADKYHVIAPDLPGFGFTTVPSDYTHNFANMTTVIESWISQLGLKDMAVYIFDYGAPVGLRLALRKPELIKAIVTQNGNAYDEGLGPTFWAPLRKLWQANDKGIRSLIQGKVLTPEGIKVKWFRDIPEKDVKLVDPTMPVLDYTLNIQGQEVNKLDLFYDYRTNVEMYPEFQRYFKESKVPILAVWGETDPSFIAKGADAFESDLGKGQVRKYFVDSGHFALETKRWEVVKYIREWFDEIKF